MSRSYEPFEIQIDPLENGQFPLHIRFLGLTKDSSIPGDLPELKPDEIEQSQAWLARGFIDRPFAQEFGARLFKTLFPAEIEALFRQALQRVEPEGGLRVLLNQPVPAEMENLPWELLYDPGGLGFLARSVRAPLVRHYTSLPLPHELPEEGPLRILLVTASPEGKPQVSSQEEIRNIAATLKKPSYSPLDVVKLSIEHVQRQRSLKGLRQRIANRHLVDIDVLPEATHTMLQNKLLEAHAASKPFHIIHFIGHGEQNDDGSFLLLEDGPIAAEDFAEMMGDPSINLVVLNACETAASGLLTSAAEACLNCSVPAVIGMQVPVLDRAAVDFAREFYTAWAAGESIEGALAYARRLISQQSPGTAADWSIPILYMGPEEGLQLQLKVPEIEIPWGLRVLRWSAVTLVSLLGTIALLLSVPDIARTIRQEVPIIRCVYPYPLQDDPSFNIALVEFDMRNADGSHAAGDDGKALSNDLYRRLKASVQELNLPVSNDLGPHPYPCPIQGKTQAEMEQQAAKFARQVRADVLIYGYLQKSDRFGEIHPQFYVNYTGFTEGLEVVGEYQIGKPLRVDIPIREVDLEHGQNKALKARNAALVNLVIGLAEYSLDDYDEALKHFQAAEAEKDWLKSQGKEIAYLMIGNAYARKAGQSFLLTDTEYQDLLKNADGAFQQALSINPAYARGLLGMTMIRFQQALGPLNAEDFDLEKINAVEKSYQDLLKRTDLPPSAHIPAKVHYGLGQVYMARAYYGKTLLQKNPGAGLPFGLLPPDQEYARAEEEFQQVVDAEASGVDALTSIASQAQASLGMISRFNNNYPQAIEHVQKAIDMSTPYYRVRFYALLGDTYRESGDCKKAIEAYQDGIAFAETTGDEKTIDQLDGILKKITCP